MRTYVVQAGDSPAQIAARFAGCPKCAIDLVVANPEKASIRHPNGFLSFRDLRAGEKLWLPDKWFSEAFDALPPAYFAALPYPDGVTPSKTGVHGALGDYATLDKAGLSVSSLASKDDAAFASSVNGVAAQIDASVVEAYGGDPTPAALADTVRTATNAARTKNELLKAALASGESASVPRLRLDVQNALTTALGAARITLEALHASTGGVEVDIGEATVEPPAPAPTPPPAPQPAPSPAPQPAVAVTAPAERGLSVGAVAGSLLGVAALGGAIYWAVAHRRPKVRRVRRHARPSAARVRRIRPPPQEEER